MPESLDRAGLLRGVLELKQQDTRLRGIHERLGPPPLWRRPQTLATLVQVVLEQQVSLKSAQAVFDRISGSIGRVTAPNVIAMGESGLRQLGVTRQKAGYIVGLAQAVTEGRLRLASLRHKTDVQVRSELVALKGIGEWTANVYLLMALGRPDIWPEGDLALLSAMQTVCKLKQRPDPATGVRYANRWRPYRSVAARMLWHWYLNQTRA